MTIELLIQPKCSNQCSQHAVAMYSKRSLNEVFKAFGTDRATNLNILISALDKLEIENKGILKVDNRKKKMIQNFGNGFIRIQYGQRKMGHLMLYFNGKIYDSSNGIFDSLDSMLEFYNGRIKTKITHFVELI